MTHMHGHEVPIPSVQVSGVPDPVPAGLTVLDVREDHEWVSGHLADALHIPLGALPHRVAEVPANGQVLVYCHLGGRSAQATAYLQANGVEAVNLEGGVAAWEEAGRPLVQS